MTTSNNNDNTDNGQSGGTTAHDRIDEMARQAGSELRRPAPEQGFARVQRARRNRQITRAAVGGTAVVALMVGGFAVINSRSNGDTVGTADAVVTAPEPNTTTQPDTTTEPNTSTQPDTTDPATSAPVVPPPGSSVPSTDPAPAVNPPSVVYTSTESFSTGPFPSDGSVQTLLDPVDGSVIGTEPIDQDKARIAQEPFAYSQRSIVDLGAVAYDFTEVTFDSGTLPTDLFPDVDLCAQNAVTVTSPAGSALPARARLMRVSPDDRFVVTLSADCPEPGTMGADSAGTPLPYDLTVEVFDAGQPELPGRILATIPSSEQPSTLTSSGDGRFVSISTFPDRARYRIFDLDAGSEVDLGIDVGADCNALGAHYSEFIGPWVGASSVAVSVGCPTTSTLHVLDLTDPTAQLVVEFPASTDSGFVSIEVDHATFVTPQDAWFTMCNALTPVCWIGHGGDPLLELPGVAQASFLPLGFEPGG